MAIFWAVMANFLTVITLVFIIFVLFFERKESSRRFAWLLTLTFLPVIGIFLYIFFSGHFFTKTKKMNRAKKIIRKNFAPFFDDQKQFIRREIQKSCNPLFEEYETLLNMNITYGNSPLTVDNSVDMFLWGKDKFENLFADIEEAQTNINLEYFIIRNDVIGTKLIDLLCKKVSEGVQVRLMYDDFGSLFTPASFFHRLVKAGGQVTAFFPVRFGSPFSVNYRNHRKIVVIDGKIGYLGGFNVGDEYVNQSRRKKVLWRDTHVRLRGSCVSLLQMIFLMDWYSVCLTDKTIESPEETAKFFPADAADAFVQKPETTTGLSVPRHICDTGVPVQIVTSGPNDQQNSEIKDAMIRMIMSAKKSIYIQTPYFTPDDAFYTALKIAALSGIDVRIMLPDQWDKFYVKAAAQEYIREMLTFGISFYHYPGFIHSKTIVVDGKLATIGSTNIDARSFSLHFEVNAFFYSAQFGELCEKAFLDDQQKCRHAKKENLDKRFILIRAWWSFCKLFSPLM